MRRLRRRLATTIATTIVLTAAGWTVNAPDALAQLTDPMICHHHVGGMTLPYFHGGHRSQCTLFGPGTLTIEPGGDARLGRTILADGLTFLSQGIGSQYDFLGRITLEDTSVLENSGTFSTFAHQDIVGSPDALVRNDAGATWTARTTSHITVPVDNAGTMTAVNTILALPLLRQYADGVLQSGAYAVDNGRLVLPGPLTANAAELAVDRTSQVLTPSGSDALAGLARNSGRLDIASRQTVGPLVNNGQLVIAPTGVVGSSAPLDLSADSDLRIGVGADAAHGALRTASSAVIGGLLTIDTGPDAAPVPGATYPIISAAGGLSGRFTAVDGLDLPDGDHYQLEYTATGVQLVVVGPSIPLTISGVDHRTIGRKARGLEVTISGTGFLPGALVGFGDPSVLAARTTVVDNTTVVATVHVDADAPLGPRDVKVRNPGQGVAVCSGCLTVTPVPRILHIDDPVPRGARYALIPITETGIEYPAAVTVTGPSTGVTAIYTYGQTSSYLYLSVQAGAALGSYSVRVVNPDGGRGGCSDCLAVGPALTVSSLDPSAISRGTKTKISLTGTSFTSDATVFGPSGVDITNVHVIDAEHLTAHIYVTDAATLGPDQAVTVTDGALGGYTSAAFAGLTIT